MCPSQAASSQCFACAVALLSLIALQAGVVEPLAESGIRSVPGAHGLPVGVIHWTTVDLSKRSWYCPVPLLPSFPCPASTVVVALGLVCSCGPVKALSKSWPVALSWCTSPGALGGPRGPQRTYWGGSTGPATRFTSHASGPPAHYYRSSAEAAQPASSWDDTWACNTDGKFITVCLGFVDAPETA